MESEILKYETQDKALHIAVLWAVLFQKLKSKIALIVKSVHTSKKNQKNKASLKLKYVDIAATV